MLLDPIDALLFRAFLPAIRTPFRGFCGSALEMRVAFDANPFSRTNGA